MQKSITLVLLTFLTGLFAQASAANVILEDDFYQGQQGPVSGRPALKGGTWQGTAVVTEGVGLHHGGDSESRSAFIPLTIPPNTRKITVTVQCVLVGGGGFSYGFTDNPSQLSGQSGNNQGLIWGSYGGRGVTIRGGRHHGGGMLNARVGDYLGGDPTVIELTVQPTAAGKEVPVTLTFNGLERINGSVATTETPKFSHFFISFGTGINPPSQDFAFHVKVEAE